MNVLWRFLWTVLFSRFSPAISLLEECTTSFYVLPTDIDLLKHMNNGRYFSLMDIARVDFMIRNKTFNKLKQHKVYPVVAAEMIRFKKSLGLFQQFQLSTRLLGWNEKYFYLLHHFKNNQEIYAASLVKICFLKNGSKISTATMLQYFGEIHHSPILPSWVDTWQQTEQAFYHDTIRK